MSLCRFNIFSSRASSSAPEFEWTRGTTTSPYVSKVKKRTLSYFPCASSESGDVPNGISSPTDPSLDVDEDIEVSNIKRGPDTNIAQTPEITRKVTRPRYLYYRIYTKYGAIASSNPIYSNDQSLSRILTKSVAPPHTVASLQKHLCKIEGFPQDAQSCCLFGSLSDQKAMDEAAPLSLFSPSNSGLGSSEHDPVALVVGLNREFATVESRDLPEHPEIRNPSYIHYRLYLPEGEFPSKMAFNESDRSLGRVRTLAITPPYTMASLKACLIKSEGVLLAPFWTKLFAAMNSEAPMGDDDPLELLTDIYPGSNGDDPMAFVVDTTSMLVKARCTFDYSTTDPSWLSIAQGEVLATNGVTASRKYKPYGSSSLDYQGYNAVNSSGKSGFVPAVDVEFC